MLRSDTLAFTSHDNDSAVYEIEKTIAVGAGIGALALDPSRLMRSPEQGLDRVHEDCKTDRADQRHR